jgi:hypothetical protein
MEQLVLAGILYLIVMAIVLAIKPRCMFTETGTWKEFGIGRSPETHTWMPFWLFAIAWALLSYILTTIVLALRTPKANQQTSNLKIVEEVLDVEPEELTPPPKRIRRLRGSPTELPDGYYVLNTAATEASGGIPKYVYLGRGLPS